MPYEHTAKCKKNLNVWKKKIALIYSSISHIGI